jgi:polyhydroxybutyrate depolymerase
MNFRLFILFIVIICISFAAQSQQDQTITIISGGKTRTFDLHLPSNNPMQNLPLIICYHGTGGSSAGMKFTGFNGLADKFNFIVAYPQSLKIGNDVQWNVFVDDKPGHAGVGDDNAPDDILFTRNIIEKLFADYMIDRNRVFATGLSNGAFMCYALSMFAYNEIAAIAPVAGNLWGDEMYLGQLLADGNVTPIPVMHIHGTADNVVAYPDKDNTPKDYQEYPLFVASRGCGAVTYNQVIPIMENVDKLVFCPPPVEVSLIRITGMGHNWSNGSYNTSEGIVEFFGLDNSNTGINIESTDNDNEICQDVIDEFLTVNLESSAIISLINSLGKVVYKSRQEVGIFSLPIVSFDNGVYVVSLVMSNGQMLNKRILLNN